MKKIKIDKIIRSRRRSIGMQIMLDTSLLVRAPMSASQVEIERVVADHADWIVRAREYVRTRPVAPHSRKYVNGEIFYYQGEPYPLIVLDDGHPQLRFQNGFFLPESLLPEAKNLFSEWYISKARDIIPERARLYARKNGYKFNRIRITRARRRWGSCSGKGNLNFSFRLAMVPVEALDYVVVHELAHLNHRNHSKKFWTEVERMMPDYKQHIKWLRTNEKLIRL